MPERYRTRKLSAAVQRAVEVAAAVATEEIITAHVSYILELVEIAGDRVTPQRATDIYLRVHALEEAPGQVVRNRVLAEFGHRERAAPRPPEPVPPATPDPPPAESRGPFGFLRGRFRGRVQTELRRWIELHTGRSEVRLLDIHVRNALTFIATLPADVPTREAVAIYGDRVGVRPEVGEVLLWLVLDRLSDKELPSARPADVFDLRSTQGPQSEIRRIGTPA